MKNYLKTVMQYETKGNANLTRKCTAWLFLRKNRNGETTSRFWLCFSPTTGKVYCYICKLVNPSNTQIVNDGYCDWKHGQERLKNTRLRNNI